MLEQKLTDITKLQQQATAPDCSCFVSASAGTGKTKVLVDRFIRLMLETGAAPKSILCITYTNTAADEIKHRLIKKLEQLNNAPNFTELLTGIVNDVSSITPQQINNAYNIFLKQYNELKISTIHGFCFQILQRYAHLLNKRSPNIIDPKEAATYMQNAVSNALLAHPIQTQELLAEYEILYLHKILKNTINALTVHRLKFRQAEYTDIQSLKDDFFNDHSLQFEKAFMRSFDNSYELINFLQSFFYTKAGKRRKKTVKLEHLSEAEFESISSLAVNAILQFKSAKFENINYNINFLAQYALADYCQQKEQNFLVDFNDILHQTHDALLNDAKALELLYHIDLSIDHIMLDEAQDTSPAQWDILKLITDEYFAGFARRSFAPTIFIVGDFKQSIYSFQGANPHAFSQAWHHFQQAADGKNTFYKVDFNTSFRSSHTILQFVDKVFASPALSSAISQDDRAIEHLPFKPDDGAVFLHPIVESADDDPAPTSPELEQALADKITLSLIQDIQNQRIITGLDRRIEPEDVMIIFRKRSSAYYHTIKKLSDANLPVSSNQVLSLKNCEGLNFIACALRFICFIYDDHNLFTLLQSPFFRLESEQITQIFFNRSNATGLEVLQKLQPEAYKILQSWLELRTQNINMLLQKIMLEQNFLEQFIKHYGVEFKAQYHAFINEIERIMQPNQIDLLTFVSEHLEQIKIHEKFNNNSKSIKVITAHAAKGLQAKIVILADATSTDNQPHDALLHDKSSGELLFMPNKQYLPKWVESLNEQSKIEDFCESLRLLYVAITRAENELHIYGRKTRNMHNSWYQMLSNAYCDDFKRPYSFANKMPANDSGININLPKFKGILTELQPPLNELKIYNPGLKSGEMLHKYLQHLPSIITNATSDKNIQFLQAKNIINNYTDLFFAKNNNTRVLSEVEIKAGDDQTDQSIIGQNFVIDKLIISPDQITIIDFKNDRKVSDQQLLKYQAQINRYKLVISAIYPKHTVLGHLLFCNKNCKYFGLMS